jgi:hypothetical protein
MSYCPQCEKRYEDSVIACPDCRVTLVATLPEEAEDHALDNYVFVANAPDQQTAEMIVATLEAAGIEAILQHESIGPAEGLMPYLGLDWNRGVAVPVEQEAEARAILEASAPTEEELIAEEAEDPVTLEEAEARVRNA